MGAGGSTLPAAAGSTSISDRTAAGSWPGKSATRMSIERLIAQVNSAVVAGCAMLALCEGVGAPRKRQVGALVRDRIT